MKLLTYIDNDGEQVGMVLGQYVIGLNQGYKIACDGPAMHGYEPFPSDMVELLSMGQPILEAAKLMQAVFEENINLVKSTAGPSLSNSIFGAHTKAGENLMYWP